MALPYLVDVDASTFAALPCCGIRSSAHPGRADKCRWLGSNSGCGLRAKTLMTPEGAPVGYIEYLPGEFAWRGVDAAGYLFIHCLWMHSKVNQRKGWGALMVDACVRDAKSAHLRGVAVMVREGPWLADRRLFLRNGFASVDTAPPDYELLVRKLKRGAANPAIRRPREFHLERYGKGLTIVRCAQCPYNAKFTADIAAAAVTEFHLTPAIHELSTYTDAQDGPTPYAVFAVIYNGRLLADHQISRTRFRNIIKKLAPGL
jgi:hypothetical protein